MKPFKMKIQRSRKLGALLIVLIFMQLCFLPMQVFAEELDNIGDDSSETIFEAGEEEASDSSADSNSEEADNENESADSEEQEGSESDTADVDNAADNEAVPSGDEEEAGEETSDADAESSDAMAQENASESTDNTQEEAVEKEEPAPTKESVTKEPSESKSASKSVKKDAAVGDSNKDNTLSGEDQVTAIYLNTKTGDDSNDGSKENPVKTFERAKALLAEHPNADVIYVNGTINAEGEMSLPTGKMLKRDSGSSSSLISVANGKELTLSDIIVDGAAISAYSKLIEVAGTLIMNQGTVVRNAVGTGWGGAIYVASQGKFVMNDGVIENNKATHGAGVLLDGEMEMNGGVIQNNNAKDRNYEGDGGGIFVTNKGRLTINNGIIRNNTAYGRGGGISVGGLRNWSTNENYYAPKVYMYNGEISGNKSGAAGGGMFVQAGGYAYISSGLISNNVGGTSADWQGYYIGGGIYVNGGYEDYNGLKDGRLDIQKVYISNNTSREQGGGIANCPTSKLSIYMSDGAAVGYNYQRYMFSSVRDDFFATAGDAGFNGVVSHIGNPIIYLSSVMLGGEKNNWKIYKTDTNIDYLDQYYQVTGINEIYLVNDISREDLEKAYEKATVFVVNNRTGSGKGGGIGSNGIVNIGVENPAVGDLEVSKTVRGDEESKGKEFKFTVTLDYKISGTYGDMEFVDGVAEFTLKDGETKKASGLMADMTYTVEEEAVDGFRVTYEGDKGSIVENIIALAKFVNTQLTNIDVEKKWAEDKEEDRPESITIRLLANGEEVASKKITAEDDWKGVFEDLDVCDEADEAIEYTIVEDEVPGYVTTIDGFVVKNTKKPDEPEVPDVPGTGDKEPPEEPEEPEIPEEPEVPEEPEEPETPPEVPEKPPAPPKTPKTGTPTTVVSTGDDTNAAIWGAGFAVAGFLIYMLLSKTKRRK